MKIIDVLKHDFYDTRVSCGDKWLIYDTINWVVYQRKYCQKKTRILVQTESEEEAVKVLIKD